VTATALLLLTDPPLDTPPDEARSTLRRELLRPEYHDQNVVQRVLEEVQRQVARALEAASGAPPLSTFAALVVFAGLILLLGWLVSRARRTTGGRREERPVLTVEVVSADELRARAEAALASGRNEDAVVDGFRAVVVRQVERGRLPDAPGATAHEVADALGAEFPHALDQVVAGGRLFDAVLYGDRPATAEQATSVLALDDQLLARR
jgi:hypothetical protein